MRILCAGGGSGGHVTPVVAVLDEIKRLSNDELTVRFVCDSGFAPQARSIMAGATMPVSISTIRAGKFRRYKHFRLIDYVTTPSVLFHNLIDIVQIAIGFIQSMWLILRFRPDIIFAKGGFVCLPVGWAARLCRVPIVIHDSDARPGLTNRLIAPFARAIATGYPLENYPYDQHKSTYTGVPIRAECRPVTSDMQRSAKSAFGISSDTRLTVGVGGGLGAKAINVALIEAAKTLPTDTHCIIVAGVKHYEDALQAANGLANIEILEFVAEGMVELLSAADIVVTRASATSLQELAGLQKPIIAVPARQLGDQHKNAELYAAADAAIVLDDDALEHGELTTTLATLLDDPTRQEQLSKNLHAFAKPHAATDVAQIVLNVAAAKH